MKYSDLEAKAMAARADADLAYRERDAALARARAAEALLPGAGGGDEHLTLRLPEATVYVAHRAALVEALRLVRQHGDPRWSADWLRNQIKIVDDILRGAVTVISIQLGTAAP